MTLEQMLKNLQTPTHPVDVVLDTDAYNEIDDQFAISYMVKNPQKLNIKAIYAAPFYNQNSENPADGMEKSYNEILKLLDLLGENYEVFKGSTEYLSDEKTPVLSPASEDLISRAMRYSSENPLYVVAIGAITNIASALIKKPEIAEKIVIVWLGGHAHHYADTHEFNMYQDIAAARVVMESKAAFIQLPCNGVVSEFRISGADIKEWLLGKNPLSDYLGKNTIQAAEEYANGKPWTRPIWDVVAVAWLLNEDDKFMQSRIINTRLPQYDSIYSADELDKPMTYVYYIKRDALMEDLLKKLTS